VTLAHPGWILVHSFGHGRIGWDGIDIAFTHQEWILAHKFGHGRMGWDRDNVAFTYQGWILVYNLHMLGWDGIGLTWLSLTKNGYWPINLDMVAG